MVFWAACFGMFLFGIGLITLGSIVSDLKTKFQLDEVAAGTLFITLISVQCSPSVLIPANNPAPAEADTELYRKVC